MDKLINKVANRRVVSDNGESVKQGIKASDLKCDTDIGLFLEYF